MIDHIFLETEIMDKLLIQLSYFFLFAIISHSLSDSWLRLDLNKSILSIVLQDHHISSHKTITSLKRWLIQYRYLRTDSCKCIVTERLTRGILFDELIDTSIIVIVAISHRQFFMKIRDQIDHLSAISQTQILQHRILHLLSQLDDMLFLFLCFNLTDLIVDISIMHFPPSKLREVHIVDEEGFGNEHKKRRDINPSPYSHLPTKSKPSCQKYFWQDVTDKVILFL